MADMNLFSLLLAAEKLADTIATDASMSAEEKRVAASLRDSVKSWKDPSFRVREYKVKSKK